MSQGPVHDEPAWDEHRLAAPHEQADKAERVRRMFDAIAPTYELVNRVFSGGRDKAWRREMIRLAAPWADDVLLDVACGTGDVVRAFAGAPEPPGRLVGADFSGAMLGLAAKAGPEHAGFVQCDALRLPFADGSVSIVTCAFGIRNFQDLSVGLREMRRVLRPGGRAAILEFSLPRSALLRRLYLFYINRIMPWGAALISRDRAGAYRYLPRSVVSFRDRGEIVSLLRQAGFDRVQARPLTLGIVTLYLARA